MANINITQPEDEIIDGNITTPSAGWFAIIIVTCVIAFVIANIISTYIG